MTPDEELRMKNGIDLWTLDIQNRVTAYLKLKEDTTHVGGIIGLVEEPELVGKEYTDDQAWCINHLHESVDVDLLMALMDTLNTYNVKVRSEGNRTMAINNIATMATVSYAAVMSVVANTPQMNEMSEEELTATVHSTAASVGDYIHAVSMMNLNAMKVAVQEAQDEAPPVKDMN